MESRSHCQRHSAGKSPGNSKGESAVMPFIWLATFFCDFFVRRLMESMDLSTSTVWSSTGPTFTVSWGAFAWGVLKVTVSLKFNIRIGDRWPWARCMETGFLVQLVSLNKPFAVQPIS